MNIAAAINPVPIGLGRVESGILSLRESNGSVCQTSPTVPLVMLFSSLPSLPSVDNLYPIEFQQKVAKQAKKSRKEIHSNERTKSFLDDLRVCNPSVSSRLLDSVGGRLPFCLPNDG